MIVLFHWSPNTSAVSAATFAGAGSHGQRGFGCCEGVWANGIKSVGHGQEAGPKTHWALPNVVRNGLWFLGSRGREETSRLQTKKCVLKSEQFNVTGCWCLRARTFFFYLQQPVGSTAVVGCWSRGPITTHLCNTNQQYRDMLGSAISLQRSLSALPHPHPHPLPQLPRSTCGRFIDETSFVPLVFYT